MGSNTARAHTVEVFSPKRACLFEEIKAELAPDSPGLRVLCPTRWTVRGESLQRIVRNYGVLHREWCMCLETRLEPDIRASMIGVQTQMQTFTYIFGLILGEKILKHTDNLSRTLQQKDLSAAEGQAVAELTIKALRTMRNDETFQLFWKVVEHSASKYDVNEPCLPRCRKVPRRYELGTGEAEFLELPET